MTISIQAAFAETIDIDLVGVRYKITPPKAGLAIQIARLSVDTSGQNTVKVLDLLDKWIDRAFGEEQAAAVRARMYEDDEDQLDLPHLIELVKAVMETQSGNPTS